MAYDLAEVADALADALEKEMAGTVKVHRRPVPTFNVPCLIVAWPERVEPSGVAFNSDRVRLPIMAAVGLDRTDMLSTLMRDAHAALYADRGLGGAVRSLTVVEYRNFRPVNVAGADFLTAELLLEIHA